MRPSSLLTLGLAGITAAVAGCTALLGDIEPTSGSVGGGGQLATSITTSTTITSSAASSVASSGAGGMGGAGGTGVASSASASSASGTGGAGGALDCTNLAFDPSEPASCTACVKAQCCIALTPCAVGSQCFNYAECKLNCMGGGDGGPDPCGCGQTNLEGAIQFIDLELCALNECGGAGCLIQGSPVCGTTFQATPAACSDCIGTTCCPQVSACSADPSCLACALSQPGCTPGNANYQSFLNCTQQCANACL